MIASKTNSTPITATVIDVATEAIPAHAIGAGGYLVFDFFATRTGSASNILILFSLGGESFYADTMLVGDDNLQSRFILYANKLTATLKTDSGQSVIHSPYFKGPLVTQVLIDVDINVDNDLTIGAVIFQAPDTFTLEGYSIRTFNPSTSKNIISGKT